MKCLLDCHRDLIEIKQNSVVTIAGKLSTSPPMQQEHVMFVATYMLLK